MSRRSNPTLRFGMVVACAAVLLALVLVTIPDIVSQLASPGFVIATVFMVVISFLLTLGIRKLADTVLPGTAKPWYVRRGSVPFMAATVIMAGILTCLLGVSAPAAAGLRAPPLPLALESIAFVVIWILRLDWPGRRRRFVEDDDDEDDDEDDDGSDGDRQEPDWYHLPRQSSPRRLWEGLTKGKRR